MDTRLALVIFPAVFLAATSPAHAEIAHGAWDALLRAHVSDSRVDYRGFAKERPALDAYRRSIAEASGELDFASLLNGYNAAVVASVLDTGQPARVLDVKGFFKERKHVIAGRELTLDELETRIRSRFKDPRIHFALNCAAVSCPPLYERAFTPGNVDAVLSERTRRFLNGAGVVVDAQRGLVVSSLFDWYKDDFIAKEGSVAAYLKRWVSEPGRRAALDAGRPILFQVYDWQLNRR